MDKKSLIGLGLIAVILISWLALNGPSKEQIARNKQIKDSVELAAKNFQAAANETTEKTKSTQATTVSTSVVISDSLNSVKANSIYKDFSTAASGIGNTFILENENIKVYISNKGGKINKVELKNYKRYGHESPLILFDNDSTSQYLKFDAYANSKFVTDSFYFSANQQAITKINGTQILNLKLQTNQPGSYIEYVYTLKPDNFLVNYDVNFVGMQNIIPAKANHITLHWSQAMPTQEKHITKEREVATVYYNETKGGVDFINARKSEEKLFTESNIKWVSFKQHFFNSTLIASKEDFLKENSFVKTSENPLSTDIVKTITSELSIPYKHNGSETFAMQFYFGPTQYKILKNLDHDMQKLVPTGWSVFSYINKWMVIPLFNSLSGLNSGLIILILTLILKTVLFPIAYKTYMSGAKMRVLKPEIDVINAKYEKDPDPMKKQQETMSLYRRAGANPLSGCLPMLLQFPILIALFAFIPASIELRQKGFLWADDLSTYDSVYNFGFSVWGYGDHISLFAILMFVSTIIYTWMNSALLQPQQTQMPGMKYMMYLMPVIFLAVMNSYSAGLSWYYFLANVITFLQTWLMRKMIDDGKIREKLLANMTKPEKKSAFQSRLEEMSKQRQQLPPKKK